MAAASGAEPGRRPSDRWGRAGHGRCGVLRESSAAASSSAAPRTLPEQLLHRLDPRRGTAGGSRPERPSTRASVEVRQRRVALAAGVVGERTDQTRLDAGCRRGRRLQRPRRSGRAGPSRRPGRRRRGRTGTGDQEPGEGEVVELGEVGRFVRRRDTVLASPGPGVGQPALGDADPGYGGWDRPHVGEEAGQVQRLRLLEHLHGAVQVTARAQQTRPWRCTSGAGSPAARLGRRAHGRLRRCLSAASSSPCSHSTSARPTCRSPVVESTGPRQTFGGLRGRVRRAAAPRRAGRAPATCSPGRRSPRARRRCLPAGVQAAHCTR